MAYIKKLVAHGFKSFAKKTEIPFNNGINVIIGPNGSGKSNVSDAICFALGRLSAKSMRAEKAKNLIFMGSKYHKPAKEAVVEIFFDNSDKAFALDTSEVVLTRIVRVNGQSIYKLNGETKTRAEIIEILGQAGIDPYGYNLILQGQIQSIIRMHGEERRKIIGEVAGISVYEWRKEKSLKELEKTEERLKEISTILRERSAQLNNLERERAQAKRFKELELTVKRAKATITHKRLEEKTKEINQILRAIEEKSKHLEKESTKSESLQKEIEEITAEITLINKKIREATGLEQGRLREEITNLRAELEGLKVRREGQEHRKEEVERRVDQIRKNVPEAEAELKTLREKSPLMAKKTLELKKKKEELSELEKERKSFLAVKSEIESLKHRIEDKKNQLARAIAESDSLIEQIERVEEFLISRNEKEAEKQILHAKEILEKEKKKILEYNEEELKNVKVISAAESTISRSEEIKNKVNQLDLCPVCQSKITKEHISHVFEDCNNKISISREEIEKSSNHLEFLKKEKNLSIKIIVEHEELVRKFERELISQKSIEEKKERIKKETQYAENLKKEIVELEKRKSSLEAKKEGFSEIENKYREILYDIEEISSRTEENIDNTLTFKERELERMKSLVEKGKQDKDEIITIINELETGIKKAESSLSEKEKKESELNARFKKMFEERDKFQSEIQEKSVRLSETQSEVRQIEDQINYLKIGKSKIDGEKQVIEMDLQEYSGVEFLQGSLQSVEERMKKAQETLSTIGSINMRALEVYDEIKEEYDKVKEKTDIIEKEKIEILKIIEEIDKKKKKIFMKTFNSINEIFRENFSRLTVKGATAYLEPENKEDLFEGGIDIVVKMGKGKYFDVHSLSGGEQTLVALSLLFAIQEYKPYHFYILDEVDAALDKRNSEKLASLLQRFIKSGQYIIVTHNDAIILDSEVLYGISMHEGVSKVLSLKMKN